MPKKFLEPLFQAIFAHPSIGAVITDQETRFLLVNSKFCQMLGYDESELLGKKPIDFTLIDDHEKTKLFQQGLIKSQTGCGEYEKRFRRKDGSVQWSRVIVRRIPDPEDPQQFINVTLVEDISSEKDIQAQAEIDQLQLAAILDASMFGVWCVDTSWQITYSNRALRAMLGYNVTQMLSLNLRELTHPEDLQETNSKFDQTKPGENYQAKRRYLKHDGTYLWTRLSVSKFPENDLNLYGLAIVEDITELMKSENLIQEQQVKMVSSAKMAALGEMAGGIAHEINNPLAVIIGKMDQVSRKLDSTPLNIEDIKSDLGKVKNTADRIATIVKGLRIFSRDADSDPWITTSIQSLVNDAITLCQERLKAHGIGITLSMEDDLFINCRPTQVVQVLINLLSNSMDAIDPLVDKWISLDAKKIKNKILISVTDSGNGIVPQVANKMVQPFFTTKPIGKGTGLGLSISMGIVQEHKGSLIYDEKCKNTCFILELPSCDATGKFDL